MSESHLTTEGRVSVEEKEPWTVARLLKWATDDFRARGLDEPRLDAELLLGLATGRSRVQLFVDLAREPSPEELARFRALVVRRRSYEPIAYMLGEREFFGRSFKVDKRVLIPRPDTEVLVEVALARSNALSVSSRILDLCTGSGCVAITLAKERPTAEVVATDVSEDALALARENALRLGAYNATFHSGDLLDADVLTDRTFDVVVSNPPYISKAEFETLPKDVSAHEPTLALLSGETGLEFYRRLTEGGARVLAPCGVLAVEVGYTQADAVARLFEAAGYTEIQRARDLQRIERVISGVRPAR